MRLDLLIPDLTDARSSMCLICLEKKEHNPFLNGCTRAEMHRVAQQRPWIQPEQDENACNIGLEKRVESLRALSVSQQDGMLCCRLHGGL